MGTVNSQRCKYHRHEKSRPESRASWKGLHPFFFFFFLLLLLFLLFLILRLFLRQILREIIGRVHVTKIKHDETGFDDQILSLFKYVIK